MIEFIMILKLKLRNKRYVNEERLESRMSQAYMNSESAENCSETRPYVQKILAPAGADAFSFSQVYKGVSRSYLQKYIFEAKVVKLLDRNRCWILLFRRSNLKSGFDRAPEEQ